MHLGVFRHLTAAHTTRSLHATDLSDGCLVLGVTLADAFCKEIEGQSGRGVVDHCGVPPSASSTRSTIKRTFKNLDSRRSVGGELKFNDVVHDHNLFLFEVSTSVLTFLHWKNLDLCREDLKKFNLLGDSCLTALLFEL